MLLLLLLLLLQLLPFFGCNAIGCNYSLEWVLSLLPPPFRFVVSSPFFPPPLPKSSLPWSPTPQVWGMGLWVRLEWRVKPWSGRVGSPTVTLGLRLVCVWPSEGQSAMPWSFPTLVWRLLRGFQAGNPNWDLRLKMVPRGRLCAPPHPARSKVPPHSAAKLRKLSANVGRFAASACLRCSAPRPQACCHGRSTESMAAISEKHIHRDETLGWGGTSGRETVLRGRFPSGRAERYCSTSLRSSTAYNRDAELPALRQQRARTVARRLVWDNLTSDGGRRFGHSLQSRRGITRPAVSNEHARLHGGLFGTI
jgi:hypothetical protein